MLLVHEYGCPMEQVSVDEAFVDATECAAVWEGAVALATDMQRRIRDDVGLPCTLGIASNKLIAKIACNQGKPNGVLQVPAGDEARFLAPLPLSKLWGVGPKGAAQLETLGIHTIGDLQTVPLETLQRQFGSWALDLQRKARGQDSSLVETEHEVKSVSRETTFVKDVGDLVSLKRVLLSLAEQVGRDLRDAGLRARTIVIKLRWPDFTTITRQTTLAQPVDSDVDIYAAAAPLLTAALKRGTKVRLLGVRAANLASGRQLSFFDTDSDKRARLDKAVDGVRDRFGDKAIRRAALVRKRNTPHAGT